MSFMHRHWYGLTLAAACGIVKPYICSTLCDGICLPSGEHTFENPQLYPRGPCVLNVLSYRFSCEAKAGIVINRGCQFVVRLQLYCHLLGNLYLHIRLP